MNEILSLLCTDQTGDAGNRTVTDLLAKRAELRIPSNYNSEIVLAGVSLKASCDRASKAIELTNPI